MNENTLQTEMTELRTACAQLSVEIAELRPDFSHVDRRVSKLFVLQFATLATLVASLVAALVS